MNKLFIILALSIFSINSFAQDISGNWIGILEIQGTELDFGFNLVKNGDNYKTTMNVPKQGLINTKVEMTTFLDSALTISHPALKMEYQGRLNQLNEITGKISLAGNTFPMNIKKGKIEINRPQEPKTPFDYYSEDLTFLNEKAKITLSGTLTLPKEKGNFPVAIIISGSGPQNRDGEMFGHKPYLVIADFLTKNGVGVLRFDERGVGKSEGDFKTATIKDFSSDINSAINYLKNRDDINSSKIGLIGHSIGGIIAPKVASENTDVNYIVLLAGPGINGDKLMLSQKAALERIMGLNEMQIAQGQDLVKGAYDIIVNSDLDTTTLKDSLNSFYTNKYGNLLPKNQKNALVNQITGYEIVSLIKSKPIIYLSKVKCAVLALNGSKDFQVPAKENLGAIKKILEENGNNNAKTIELENLNHLFQECKTGALSEYSQIEQTISPAVLQLITDWIKEQTK
ncbi:alpha/beta hydrolase family protein [Winogradskyella sp. UBA3174]|uniref:alpha/beta hydrolase family protein n=1 Tax=Winogradskyella sp. UBA3174 TaxID=1947785 RepID=UPI0025D259BE|nr:alpha/beta fold hydrolase [Winogradskyella sp. UBA3174]